jgi:hypothetical protein
MKISEKIAQLKSIDLDRSFDEVLKENEKDILDMARGQMYDQGIMNVDKPNEKLHYAPSTIKAKKRAPFNRTEFITLKWTGKFFSKLKLLIFKDKFVISSTDTTYANFIEPQERFGHALGLTSDSKAELRDKVKDEMIRKVRKQLSNLK